MFVALLTPNSSYVFLVLVRGSSHHMTVHDHVESAFTIAGIRTQRAFRLPEMMFYVKCSRSVKIAHGAHDFERSRLSRMDWPGIFSSMR
jgi:hypothetical protein